MPFEVDGIRQFTRDELKTLLKDGNMQIIDVRTAEEYEDGHIPSIPHRPMQEVERWASELSPSKSYVFVCRSGGRSQRVAQFLKQRGFVNVANFSGGMLGWDGDVETGRPS